MNITHLRRVRRLFVHDMAPRHVQLQSSTATTPKRSCGWRLRLSGFARMRSGIGGSKARSVRTDE